MKGGSKAARRRNRGGRPLQRGVKREGNGRASRRKTAAEEREAMTEVEAMSVAIEARMRRTGLSAEVAGANVLNGPNAGTVHGVIRLKKLINDDQWSAAEWYIGCRLAWQRAIQAPERPNEAPPAGNNAAADADEYSKWCRHIVSLWGEVVDCLTEAGTQHRAPIKAALDVILIQEHDLAHLYGDLRIGLNAIHKRFLAGRRDAA